MPKKDRSETAAEKREREAAEEAVRDPNAELRAHKERDLAAATK